MLRYRCLILDHDDTVVKTTSEIHFPSFVQTLAVLRPDLKVEKEKFLEYCMDPGFFVYLDEILKFTEEEREYQLKSWLDYLEDKIPSHYDGIKEIINRQKEEGGYVCVISHSYGRMIERDWLANFGVLPDLIYGCDLGEGKIKPSTYPLEQIQAKLGVTKSDMIMVDDLKPGLDMSMAFGCSFACAGWSHSVDSVKSVMKNKSPVYLTKTGDLYDLLFR